MLSKKEAVCRKDADDLYHRVLKFAAVPTIAVYSVHALYHEAQQVTGNNQTGYLSTSGDSRLKMTLSSPMPKWMLLAHGRGALALCTLVFLQKEVVRRMAENLRKYRSIHVNLGYLTLACLFIMDAAGYWMCGFSTFENFQLFAIFFAMPFALWLVGIYASARAGWWRSHAFLSNMLLKGCIATPLSRLGGAALQQRGYELAPGYYQGIFGVAFVIGVWQLADSVSLARELRPQATVTVRQSNRLSRSRTRTSAGGNAKSS